MKKHTSPMLFHILPITISLIISNISADEYCEMKLTACPENFHNRTIYVPRNVTRIAPDFFVCMPTNFIEDVKGTGGSPSIMFVIDHSGSMSGINGGTNSPTDIAGTRFTVTKALIDTIQKKYPEAEIGLVIFQNVLYIDTINQPYAVPLPDYYPYPDGIRSQGYIPLMRLNSTLPNGQRAINLLKNMLETVTKTIPGTRQNPSRETTDLVYKPTYETDFYTNINTAFDAAKYAMLKATNPKEHQFIIFLSDGEPLPQNSSFSLHGNKRPNDFEKGTDVPTTFTVYFVPQERDVVPASISRMTRNIKANGFSSNNHLSDVWGIQTSYTTLLNVLMEQAINPIFSLIKREPTRLVLNNKTYTSYNFSDSSFFIPDLVLQNDSTKFDLSITYSISKDSSYTMDTTAHITFNVIKTDSVPMSRDVYLDCNDTVYYRVSVNAIQSSASEQGPRNGAIQFTRNSNEHGDLTVYFSVSGTATPQKDYSPIPDSIVFTGTHKSVTLIIEPILDTLKEEQETVIITLLEKKSNRKIRYSVDSPSSATVSIDDHQIPAHDRLIVIVTPNPFPLRRDFLLRDYIGNAATYYSNIVTSSDKGVLISVQSTKPFQQDANNPDSYGSAFIYDAVGNTIKQLHLQKANDFDSTTYGMIWDGTNNQKRKVGGGVYLMKVNVKNTAGIARILTKKIGMQF